jgi:hypothetical protein
MESNLNKCNREGLAFKPFVLDLFGRMKMQDLIQKHIGMKVGIGDGDGTEHIDIRHREGAS